MCGIVGTYNFSRQPADLNRLRSQVGMLAHRGPDSKGIWVDGSVAFGHTRLSIIDLSEAGHQPMISPDGNHVLIYNGEIYNFAQLRQALGSRYQFRGSSDTEVLLYSLIEEGKDLFTRLEGMFAFAFYSRLTRKLWLVRDPFGIKPLYYHLNSNRIVFSSEIKPLFLDAETPRRPNHDALRQYLLLGYCLDPETSFDEIKRLPPGHCLEVSPEGNCRVAPYWRAEELFELPVGDVTETLRESVSLHAVSDVPTGILLSGGIDSNLILSMLRREGRLTSDFRAYNIGLDFYAHDNDQYQNIERENAERSSKFHGVSFVKIDAHRTQSLSLAEIMLSIEEPIGDPTHLDIDVISATARQNGSTVLFSGHGADEAFAGYRRHVWSRHLKLIRAAARVVPIALLTKSNNNTLAQRMLGSLHRGSPYPLASIAAVGWDMVQEWNISPDWFPPGMIGNTMVPLHELLRRWSQFSFLKQMMLLDMHTYLPAQNLINLDKASMRRSVEVRVPFLYRPLVAIGLQADDTKLISGLQNKALLRTTAREVLPEFLRNAPKMGFGSPETVIIGTPEAQDLLFGEVTRQRGMFSTSRVRRLWEQRGTTSGHSAMQLYKIVVIEQWFRSFIDQNPIAGGAFQSASISRAETY